MPSHGFYIRHVKGIQFDDVEIRTARPDARPAFILEDVQDADFFRIRVPHTGGVPTFTLHEVVHLDIHMCEGVADTKLGSVTNRTL
jgi:hypothetical protein